MKFKLFLTLLIITLFHYSNAITYYISSTDGNDSNNGTTIQTPWKTLEKIKLFSFSNGDSILLKSGDIFRGTLSLKLSPDNIFIGKYGNGNNPTIKGSVLLTGWNITTDSRIPSSIRNNVYEADVSLSGFNLTNGIQHLFVNNELMTIARYPNVSSPKEKNWLKISGSTVTSNSFYSEELKLKGNPNNYWKDSRAIIRTYSWTMGGYIVSGYNAANGLVSIANLGSQNPEWGFFMDKKIQELDNQGEWFYDSINSKVFLYPKNNINPNSLTVEGMTFGNGISITNSQDNCICENINIEHCADNAINLNSSKNVKILNCKIKNCFAGIYFWNCKDVLIKNNTLDYCFRKSIGTAASSTFDDGSPIIEQNIITNNGMYIGYGAPTIAIANPTVSLYGNAMTFRKNRIENSAWTGIYFQGEGSHIVENNFVSNSLLIINDGGNLSIGSNSNNNIIRGNILINALGNTDESNGCSSTSSTPCMHHSQYGMGIGADAVSFGHIIENNIIANNTDMGIRFNKFKNSIIRNNTLYNNDPQIVIQGNDSESNNNLIKQNIIYSLWGDQIGLELQNTTNHGTIDSNYYCNPYSEAVIKRNSEIYSLLEWKEDFSNYDLNSKKFHPNFQEYSTTTLGSELILNNNFSSDIADWSKSGSGNIEWNSGELKAIYSGTGAFNLGPNNVAVTENQWYRLKFKVKSNGNGEIRIRLNNTIPNPWVIFNERYFVFDNNYKNYEWVFKAPSTTTSMKILFTTDENDANTFWLDEVYLEPVYAIINNLKEQSKLFYNDSLTQRTFNFNGIEYKDIDGNIITGSITLNPFSSKILIRQTPLTIENRFENNKISVYPNPSDDGNININFPTTYQNKNVSLKIYSIDGKMIFEKNIEKLNTPTLKLSILQKGFYVLQTEIENTFSTNKLIIN